MSTVRYLVTGASSTLGQALTQALLAAPETEIVGLISRSSSPRVPSPRVRYIEQDLLAPLGVEATAALRSADRIVHLAWCRIGTPAAIAAANSRMLDAVCSSETASKLVFVSSVAASPRSPGTYGRAKYAAQTRVLAAGGTVVVVGLLIGEPPQTAFKTLIDVLRRLPFAPLFLPNAPRVYPVLETDAVAVLAAVAAKRPPPGAYRAFLAEGVRINDFIDWCLRRYGSRKVHLPIPLPAVNVAMRTATLLGQGRLAEKLGTFFFKDDDVLGSLDDAPGTELRDTQAAFAPTANASRNA